MVKHHWPGATLLCLTARLVGFAAACFCATVSALAEDTRETDQQTDQSQPSASQSQESGAAQFSTSRKASVDFSTLWSSDVQLTDTSVQYRENRRQSDWNLSLAHSHIGIDYVPEENFESEGLPSHQVTDETFSVQAQQHLKLGRDFTLNLGAGYYDGYTDYASLWLNEYYRLLDAKYPNIELGYKNPSPWGWSAGTGLRWEYLPGRAAAQADFRYGYDVIAPGYDVSLGFYPLKLTRKQDRLDTYNGRLSFENVLSSRIRALQELQITDTTDRDLRFSAQSSVNVAIASHWVLKPSIGGAMEDPTFEAWWTGLTLERDWKDTWFVGLTSRYYTDTGKIENALPSNTAAPPVDTFELGLSLRWQGRAMAAKILAGPYWSRYDDKIAAAGFPHLYRDRDWLSLQAAFSYQF